MANAPLKILIIGSGAREHALLDAVKRSPRAGEVFVAPGNAGIESQATCVDFRVDDIFGLADFAENAEIDLTLVGPEVPLTLGMVDEFKKRGLKIFGPSKAASIVEGSKVFTKEFCARHQIPTASFRVFSDSYDALQFLSEKNSYPIVIKADGLAAGKGVVIATNADEASQAVHAMLDEGVFGTSGARIVIEDFMPGEEASLICITDGHTVVPLISAQDHKRIFDGDQGPNTGGMGCYAPAPLMSEALLQHAMDEIVLPTVAGLAAEGRLFQGFLYAGLMIGADGAPRLVEYNCRMGDPEGEVILPLLASDFVELVLACCDGQLDQAHPNWHRGACVCVVLAAEGYPASPRKGDEISGLDEIMDDRVRVFHAGTAVNEAGRIITNGGRVLAVSARADDLAQAMDLAYAQVAKIHWSGMHYRKDIGKKGLARK